jgi:hypothetical protein
MAVLEDGAYAARLLLHGLYSVSSLPQSRQNQGADMEMIEKRIPVVREHDFPYQVTSYYCPYQCDVHYAVDADNPRHAYDRLKRHMQTCYLRPKTEVRQADITEWTRD